MSIVSFWMAILAKLTADEIREWLPKLADLIRATAVNRLPKSYQTRYEEEWESYLLEIPGTFAKIVYAISLLRAASEIRALDSKFALSPWVQSETRRSLEFCFTAFTLMFLLPVLIVFSLAIRLSSPGPIVSGFRLIGRDGREFTLYRFRTFDRASTTSIGILMRKFSLDLLPYFWSVIRGDMSLIGPSAVHYPNKLVSPYRPGFITPFRVAYAVDPYPQISSFDANDKIAFLENWAKFDAEYMREATLASDLKLFLKVLSFKFMSVD